MFTESIIIYNLQKSLYLIYREPRLRVKTNKVKSEDLHFLESFQLSIYYKYYVRILFQVKIIEMQRFIELHKGVGRYTNKYTHNVKVIRTSQT